jgi:hypothetical protein
MERKSYDFHVLIILFSIIGLGFFGYTSYVNMTNQSQFVATFSTHSEQMDEHFNMIHTMNKSFDMQNGFLIVWSACTSLIILFLLMCIVVETSDIKSTLEKKKVNYESTNFIIN